MSTGGSPTNLDMLAWFSEDERDLCAACGDLSCVSVQGAKASFCLRCGAVAIDGEQVDL